VNCYSRGFVSNKAVGAGLVPARSILERIRLSNIRAEDLSLPLLLHCLSQVFLSVLRSEKPQRGRISCAGFFVLLHELD
jgi:hypothetical protein